MLLIVGIDPGTTLGLCLLDIYGEIIKLSSYKNVKRSQIINEIFRYGKPLVVGTDKNKVPKYILDLASSLGVKIIAPEHDLDNEFKNKVDEIYDFPSKNWHERDALSSAFYSYRKVKKYVTKIISLCDDKMKLEYVLDAVINHEKSIVNAMKEFEKQNEEIFKVIKRKRKKEDEEIIYLKEKIKKLKEEIRLLKFKKSKNVKKRRVINIENISKQLENSIVELKEQIKNLKEEKEKLISLIKPENIIVFKFKKGMNLDLINKEILFVNEAIKNKEILNILKEKGVTLITNRNISDDELKIFRIDDVKPLYETKDFLIYPRDKLYKSINKSEEKEKLIELIRKYKERIKNDANYD